MSMPPGRTVSIAVGGRRLVARGVRPRAVDADSSRSEGAGHHLFRGADRVFKAGKVRPGMAEAL